jgi:hypothetical protein
MLFERKSPYLVGDDDDLEEPNFAFPAAKQRTFDKHLVGFVHKPNADCFNYILSNGEISNLPYVSFKKS